MVPPAVFMNRLRKKRLSIVPFGRLNCRRSEERAGRSTAATLSASGWTTHVVVAAAVRRLGWMRSFGMDAGNRTVMATLSKAYSFCSAITVHEASSRSSS